MLKPMGRGEKQPDEYVTLCETPWSKENHARITNYEIEVWKPYIGIAETIWFAFLLVFEQKNFLTSFGSKLYNRFIL